MNKKTAAHSNIYSRSLWNKFRKNRLALWSLRVLYLFLFVAVFADFLSNEKPMYCQYEGKTYFPIAKDYLVQAGFTKPEKVFLNKDWKELKYDKVLFPPVPYSPNTISPSTIYKSPREAGNQHYLGTSKNGKDVAAGMIHGTRTALFVGIIAMFIASIIGIFLGGLAGYFGDRQIKISKARLLLNLLAIPFSIFYGFIVRAFALSEAGKEGGWIGELLLSLFIVFLVFLSLNALTPLFKKIPWLRKKIFFPIDLIVMRLIEIFNSIPALLFLIAIVSIVQKQSILNIIIIIGFLRWTSIARFVRSELLRIRELDYITAAKSMGYPEIRTLFRHALPNGLTSVLILIAFGIASAILLEASLSFLGIGVGAEEMTWGKLLSDGRDKFSAWWLAIFPGLAIFISVLLFNLIGEGLSDAINPRKRGS